MSKPATADPTMRHSMPALPYNTSSSSRRSPGSRQQPKANRPSQQHPPWASNPLAACGSPLPPLHQQGYGKDSPSPSWGQPGSWQAYTSPPRSIRSMPLAAHNSRAGRTGNAAAGAANAAKLSGAGSVSLGPSTRAGLFAGSLRQELYHAGASGLNGGLSRSLQGFEHKPSWVFTTRLDTSAMQTSQLVEASPTAAARAGDAAAAVGGAGLAAGSYQGGTGGIWGVAASAGFSRRPAGPEPPKLESFPELAALEQQFRMRQQQPAGPQLQQAQPDPQAPGGLQPAAAPFDVQLLGNNGVLLPSGLPASIQDPRSLVPVRIGVADTDCPGTSPDASPVNIALAAADSQVRPIAVPLPADLTRAAVAAASAAAAAGAAGAEAAQDAAVEGQVQPDPLALTWAQHNPWFGADEAMTRLAYEVRRAHAAPSAQQLMAPCYTAAELFLYNLPW